MTSVWREPPESTIASMSMALAGAGLAVRTFSRGEHCGHGVDHAKLSDSNLAELWVVLGQRSGHPQAVSERYAVYAHPT